MGRRSPPGPRLNAALQALRVEAHDPQCRSQTLAEFVAMKAIGIHLASARQPRVGGDRDRFGAESCTTGSWKIFAVVHAQSPRRIERCAELGRKPSDGESAISPQGVSRLNVAYKQLDRIAEEHHKLASRAEPCF